MMKNIDTVCNTKFYRNYPTLISLYQIFTNKNNKHPHVNERTILRNLRKS